MTNQSFSREDLSIIEEALKKYKSGWIDHLKEMQRELMRRSTASEIPVPFFQSAIEDEFEEDEQSGAPVDDLEPIKQIIRDDQIYIRQLEDLLGKVYQAEFALKN